MKMKWIGLVFALATPAWANTSCFPALAYLANSAAGGLVIPYSTGATANPYSGLKFPASASDNPADYELNFPNDGGLPLTITLYAVNVEGTDGVSVAGFFANGGVIATAGADVTAPNMAAGSNCQSIASGVVANGFIRFPLSPFTPNDETGTPCTHTTCDLKPLRLRVTRKGITGYNPTCSGTPGTNDDMVIETICIGR